MLSRITLHLAGTPEFPNGSAQHGYEIIAPLDASGHLEAVVWPQECDRCAVRRFWGSEPDQEGVLLHRSGGPHEEPWLIDCDPMSLEGEVGYCLNQHTFICGEYVTIGKEKNAHTFRVVGVEPLFPVSDEARKTVRHLV